MLAITASVRAIVSKLRQPLQAHRFIVSNPERSADLQGNGQPIAKRLAFGQVIEIGIELQGYAMRLVHDEGPSLDPSLQPRPLLIQVVNSEW
ncbi:hypothetical protein D3C76_1236590 [compost metagenome]